MKNNEEKLYNETLAIARNLMEKDPSLKDWVISKFPELAESEDEKIRKEIISYVQQAIDSGYGIIDKEREKSWLAWLEKHSEQKLVEQFELKAGHWYFCHQAYCCRADDLTVKEGERFMCEKDGVVKGFVIKDPEKYFIEINVPESHDEKQKESTDKGEISDGYHTFNELYHYRMLYNAAFFNLLPKEWVHKSKKHHDGEECFGGGWFIVMANLPTGQISNHYELKDWDLFQIPEKEKADEWDGHTPQEAAERLYKYLQEKQGEKTPSDKSEPKFKVGDYVRAISSGNIFKILSVNDGLYHVLCYDGVEANYPIEVEKDLVYWTIRDAKDGDVLVAEIDEEPNDFIYIFKEYEKDGFWSHCYLDAYINEFHEGIYHNNGDVGVPATKEQRELLFAKMKKAGYEWDAEMKELKKIEQKPVEWGEEDERMLKEIVSFFKDGTVKLQHDLDLYAGFLEKRLKSLKPNHWKPSEFDLQAINVAICVLEERNLSVSANILKELYEDFKKLV